MNERETYLRMRDEVVEYYRQNEVAIKKQTDDAQKQEILEKLPNLLASLPLSVWCRNGAVCHEATHCECLMCPYKSDETDIINGCADCRSFVLTIRSDVWETAAHVFGLGQVS